MDKNVIQINGGIMMKVCVSLKNVMYLKKTIFGILLHVVANMANIQQVLLMIQRLHVMKLQMWTWKLSQLTKEEKHFQQVLMKKYNSQDTEVLHFTCLFTNYHCIILSCQYLLLPAKILRNKNIYYHFTTQITN